MPTNLEIAPDGRVFVAEKRGTIQTFDSLGDSTPTLSIDLSGQIHNYEDRGLLGLAVDPRYPAEPYVYALFTYDEGDSWGDTCPSPPGATVDGCVVDGRLVRYPVNAGGVATAEPTVLVENRWCAQFPSHTVGDLQFLPDGTLVASAGDGAEYNSVDYGQNGGSPGSPTPRNPCGDAPGGVGGAMSPPTAQGGALRAQSPLTSSPVTYSGSVIRIDPDTGLAPADNPLVGSGDPAADRIIAHGLRNPFRISSRPGTREIWVGDVGWGTFEEINRIDLDAPRQGVANFGWPCYEGPNVQSTYASLGLDVCTGLYNGTLGTGVDAPVYFYQHGQVPDPGRCGTWSGASVSAVGFVGENGYPAGLHGALVFGDYTRGCVWTMELDSTGQPEPSTVQTLLTNTFVVDIEQAPDGDLVVLDIVRGQLEKVTYHGDDVPPVATISVDVDNGPVPLAVTFDANGSSDPEGGDLSFEWDLDGDGSFDDGDQPVVTFTYTDPGTVTARLRVTDPGGQTGLAQVDVHPGNTRPVVTMTSPTISSWDVGDDIPFSATVIDAEDGEIAGSEIQWSIELLHCSEPDDCHVHLIETPSGVASGSFTAPDHEYPSWLRISAWAVDSQGLTGRAQLELQPRVFDVAVNSEEVQGAQVSMGSKTEPTPFTRTVLANSTLVVSTPAVQEINGTTYAWQGWSNGGPRIQQVTFTEPTTLSAQLHATPGPGPGLSGEVAVSDLSWVEDLNGWGPAERDRSNGEIAAGDGGPLAIDGVTYTKGIGSHADFSLTLPLAGQCSRFTATVGINDRQGSLGSVRFHLDGDGTRLHSSPLLTGSSPAHQIDIDITGVNQLTLSVDHGEDNNWFDHADWANPTLTCGTTNPGPDPDPDPGPGPGLSGEVAVSDLSWVEDLNGWGPAERDRSNGEIAAGDGGPLAIDGVTYTKGIGSHADFSLTLPLAGQCSRFTATVGINDRQGSLGSVRFHLDGDGTRLHSSPLLTGSSPAHQIDIDITGVNQLTLSVDHGEDNNWFDHADWANPTLTCGTTNPGPDPDPDPGPGPGLSGEVAVSDLSWVEDLNGWGPAERDRSNGEIAAGDGGPLAIDGVTYTKGIGSHADFSLTLPLAGQCSRFTATVGINDRQGSLGSVRFHLDGDGTRLHSSPLLTGSSPAHQIDIDITGVNQLTLSVDHGEDNNWFDHADWANPTLTCGTTNPGPDPGVLSIPTGTSSHSVVLRDVNGDGRLDLVAAAAGDDAVAVAIGLPNGQFDTPVQLSTGPGSFPKYAEVADVDGDGHLDIITANQDTLIQHDVSVFFGNGNGTFSAPLQLAACSRAHQVAAGDVTGDGRIDLVVACWGGNVIAVLEGQGSRTFADPVQIEVGNAPHSLVLADFDGDGLLDVAVTVLGDNRVAVLLNDGDGTFGAPTLLWGGLGPHNVQAADLNADSVADLIVSAQNQDVVGVLIGKGDGTFAPAVFHQVGPVPKAAAVADVNGDGHPDIVVANTHGNYPSGATPTSVSLLTGNGDGTFGPAVSVPVDLTPFSVALADVNGDGHPDIAVANWHSNDVKILLGPF